MLTAAVIGCGRVGSRADRARQGSDPFTHAGAYVASPRTQLVAGVDPLPEHRAEFEALWGAPAFPTIDAMLAHVRPDLWSIATGAPERVANACRAIEAGARGLWCEKPLAVSATEAAELVQMASSRSVPIAVGYIRRWDPAHRLVRQWLREGHLGEVHHVVVRYARGVRNYGTHAIDLVRWFLGEFEWALSVASSATGDDSSPTILLGLRSGTTVAMVSVPADTYDVFELDLGGSRGLLSLLDHGRTITVRELVRSNIWDEPRVLGPARSLFGVGMRGFMVAIASELASAVVDGAPLACAGEDGVVALRIAEAVETSLVLGSMVRL